MKKNYYLALSAATVIGMSCVQPALAANAGKVAQHVSGQASYILAAIQAVGAVIGAILVVIGIATIVRAHKTDGQGGKISHGLVAVLCGGILFYMASLIETGGDSIWDGGGSRDKITITR